MIRKDVEDILLKVQKPARYVGGELGEVIKPKEEARVRFAFCFPDIYEIGMSHLGMKILYSLLNEMEGVWCERAFTPWVDMEEEMRKNKIPLYALESGDPLDQFDILGFTLQYELSYSNILNMLELSDIPVLSRDRQGMSPMVWAGGPCACNCEPICDFIDLAVIGEGEEVTPRLVELYRAHKERGSTKEQFLLDAARMDGVYVPAFYDVSYNEDKTVKEIKPNRPGVPDRVKKALVKDLDSSYFPASMVVPNIEVVHDRIMLELFRGCIRGCRFCQAGMIYRPVRNKGTDTLLSSARKLVQSTGCDEISLTSLSTSDYPQLEGLIDELLKWTEPRRISLALPSLRVDKFSPELANKVQKVRKSSLTFAPEAGTQRLRDVINKNVTEEALMNTATLAFGSGYSSIKLYFMIGLPTESDDDVAGIADLAFGVLRAGLNAGGGKKQVSVSVSASTFVPKPFTPFQWEGQDDEENIKRKQGLLRSLIRSRRITFSWSDPPASILEAVFARGDRRLGAVLLAARRRGLRLDGWDEHFNYDGWLAAMEECGIDPAFYASRVREREEIFPWEHIDMGVTREFLLKERDNAYKAEAGPNCREACLNCGASKLTGGVCQ